jgi:CDP-diacylglycerol--glycerol-3-phosphate 3-phosphatidyltransferase
MTRGNPGRGFIRGLVLNIPNLLTILRLLLSVVLFVLLGLASRSGSPPALLLDISLVLFVVTAMTDMLDGILARRLGLETTFGRIADPFADKVLVIGSFIFLLGFPQSGIKSWMVVVMISREFLVSGLRGFIEGQGKKFSAQIWGKVKVTSQYVLIGWILFFLAHATGSGISRSFTVVAAVCVTIWTALSGVAYLVSAVRILRNGADR